MTLAEMIEMANKATEGIDTSRADYAPIPAGTYDVAVIAAEGPNPTKRANPSNPNEFGQMIEITFNVTGPSHSGCRLWLRNNVIVYPKTMDPGDISKAQTAMSIGGRERKILLDSLGKTAINSAAELIGAECSAKVEIEKSQSGRDRNVIKALMPKTGKKSAAPAASAPQPAKAKMPWEV